MDRRRSRTCRRLALTEEDERVRERVAWLTRLWLIVVAATVIAVVTALLVVFYVWIPWGT